MQKKKRTVALQIDLPLSICLIILIAAAVVSTSLYFIQKTTLERAEKSTQIANFTASHVMEYYSIGWLVDYWRENCDNMALIYDSAEADKLETEVSKVIPGFINPMRVTTEQISKADAAAQKMFAELCYSRLSASFDMLQRSYHCTYICSFVIYGEECIYLLSGCDYGQLHISQGGNIYELGTKVPFSYGVYPVLDNILQGRIYENSENYIIYKTKIETDIDAFSPVYDRYGNVVMVISVDNNINDINSAALNDSIIISLITLFLLALLITMVNYLLFRKVVLPIKKEESILAEYMTEKDAEKAVSQLSGIRSDNEIETLAERFSYMASEIDRYIGEVKTVTAEKERIGAELDMAAKIQASQLPATFPAFPDRTEFDIYASMDPAKEVGGDFYDFFLIDDDHLALVIADVSGKGVPAALLMMGSKILIDNYALYAKTPSAVIGAVNDRLCEKNKDNMFVTVWLGILEISTGKLTCCNAGHEYPAIGKADGRFELLKDKHGLFVGAMPGMKYKDYEIQLEKGDTLFVYTDGVPEATNSEKELFGNDRLIDALNSDRFTALDELLQAVRKKVDEFVGEAPQFDDLTMLAVRYNGKEL